MPRPAFNICVGPDAVLLREHISELLSSNPPESGKNWITRVFRGDEPLGDVFWETLTLQGLFAEPTVVILRQAQNLQENALKGLSTALSLGSESIWPFICLEVPMEKGKFKIPAQVSKLPCMLFAQKKGWYREIHPLDQRALTGFVKNEAVRLGLEIAEAEAAAIAASLPPDAGAIKLELAKIALACPQGKITSEALTLLDHTQDVDIFAFLQGLQSGKNPMQIWQKLLKDSGSSEDADLFKFIGFLLREARILWQLLAGESLSQPLPQWVISNKQSLAKSLGFGGIARLWHLALQADKGVKCGEHSVEQGLERLIAELFRLFRPQAKA
jgi:DNA polymerase-3 subunit delta